MEDLNQKLLQLVTEAGNYPPLSLERQQRLQEVYRLVMKSGKLWQEYTPYYNDALQQMWEYCCRHPEDYDCTRAGVITWLDYNLKKRLRNFRDAIAREQQRQEIILHPGDGQVINVVEHLPAPPDIDAVLDIWQTTLNWIQQDPDGILCQTCFRKYTHINCQAIFLFCILFYLIDQTSNFLHV